MRNIVALLLGEGNGQFHMYLEIIFIGQEACKKRREKHVSLCKGQEQSGVGPGRRPTWRLEEGMVGIQLEERG